MARMLGANNTLTSLNLWRGGIQFDGCAARPGAFEPPSSPPLCHSPQSLPCPSRSRPPTDLVCLPGLRVERHVVFFDVDNNEVTGAT